jgi:hypothetical protein
MWQRLTSFSLALSLLLCQSACMTKWQARPTVDPRIVARALNDHAHLPGEPTTPDTIPNIKPPAALRTCCLFGMDLKAKLGEAPIPGYKIGNIRGIDDLGPHGYDKGNLKGENNGLVYTCRGGFIDVAHIRDNADRTLYLAIEIARQLPDGMTITLPEEATDRQVVIKPLPADWIERYGRWRLATEIAQWANYQFSIWHEIVTWYGWESVKGFSEKSSAFSIEDLYSNILGEKIAAGIILNHEDESRDAYDSAMNAWIRESLRRLGAVSRNDGRAAMAAVDGIWWDSRVRVPDNKLVTHRYLQIDPPLLGWTVESAVPKGPAQNALRQMCRDQPPRLPLSVPEQLGGRPITDFVTVELTFSGWIPKEFPIAVEKGTKLTQADFPKFIEDIRAQGKKELGPHFDSPTPPSSEADKTP